MGHWKKQKQTTIIARRRNKNEEPYDAQQSLHVAPQGMESLSCSLAQIVGWHGQGKKRGASVTSSTKKAEWNTGNQINNVSAVGLDYLSPMQDYDAGYQEKKIAKIK